MPGSLSKSPLALLLAAIITPLSSAPAACLVGTTPAARYHIDMLDLNNDALIMLRSERSLLSALLGSPAVIRTATKTDELILASAWQQLLALLKLKIPPIAAPPTGA